MNHLTSSIQELAAVFCITIIDAGVNIIVNINFILLQHHYHLYYYKYYDYFCIIRIIIMIKAQDFCNISPLVFQAHPESEGDHSGRDAGDAATGGKHQNPIQCK